MAPVYYILNFFNSLGLLIKEGLATPEQVFQQYAPNSIVFVYERYKPEIMIAHVTPSMEVHNPEAYGGFELLYRDCGGKGDFTILMGKGIDPAEVNRLKGRVHIAGSCAIQDYGLELQRRLGFSKMKLENNILVSVNYPSALNGSG
jgi:hypothetical protein